MRGRVTSLSEELEVAYPDQQPQLKRSVRGNPNFLRIRIPLGTVECVLTFPE